MSDSETTGSSDISEYGGYSDDEETATYATSKTAVREERRQHVAQKWHERIKQHYRHRKFIEPQRAEAGEQQGSDDQPSDLVQAVLALPGALVGAIPFGEDGRTAKVAPSGEPEVADDGEVELVTAQDVQAAMKRGLEDKGGAPVFSRRYIVYETKFVGPDFGVESKQERLRRESEAAPEASLLETLGGLASSVASAVGAAPEEEEEEVQPTPIPTLVPPRRPPVPLNRDVTVASSLFGKGLEAEMPKQKPKNDRFMSRSQYYGRMRPDWSYMETMGERERDQRRQRFLQGQLFHREGRDKALQRAARAKHAEARYTVILDGEGEEILRARDDEDSGGGASEGEEDSDDASTGAESATSGASAGEASSARGEDDSVEDEAADGGGGEPGGAGTTAPSGTPGRKSERRWFAFSRSKGQNATRDPSGDPSRTLSAPGRPDPGHGSGQDRANPSRRITLRAIAVAMGLGKSGGKGARSEESGATDAAEPADAVVASDKPASAGGEDSEGIGEASVKLARDNVDATEEGSRSPADDADSGDSSGDSAGHDSDSGSGSGSDSDSDSDAYSDASDEGDGSEDSDSGSDSGSDSEADDESGSDSGAEDESGDGGEGETRPEKAEAK